MADTQKISFKNNSDGPRGVHGVNGIVMIDPGKSAEVEVTEAEFRSAQGTGYFGEGEAAAEPGPLDMSIDDLTAHLSEIEDADEVEALIEAETAGKSRKGALAALEARRDELLA